jgi:hypothetical protein
MSPAGKNEIKLISPEGIFIFSLVVSSDHVLVPQPTIFSPPQKWQELARQQQNPPGNLERRSNKNGY